MRYSKQLSKYPIWKYAKSLPPSWDKTEFDAAFPVLFALAKESWLRA